MSIIPDDTTHTYAEIAIDRALSGAVNRPTEYWPGYRAGVPVSAAVLCWRDGRGLARTNVPMGDDDPEWGYRGSGPSALAKAIMRCFGAPDLSFEFKESVIARMEFNGALIPAGAIYLWINAQRKAVA